MTDYNSVNWRTGLTYQQLRSKLPVRMQPPGRAPAPLKGENSPHKDEHSPR